jgi:hypothetical protein
MLFFEGVCVCFFFYLPYDGIRTRARVRKRRPQWARPYLFHPRVLPEGCWDLPRPPSGPRASRGNVSKLAAFGPAPLEGGHLDQFAASARIEAGTMTTVAGTYVKL